MTRASTPTLLSLDRYAAIMGLNPAHFSQATSDLIFPLSNTCQDLTFQFAWQYASAIAREDIAKEIAKAELDIATYLGWWPAPTWIAQDVAMFPRFHRPEYWQTGGYNVRFAPKGIKTRFGKLIEPGQRAVTFISTATAQGAPCSKTFSDEDGDTFDETVTVTCTGITTTDECEIKVYFHDHNGDPEWEIRPARTKTLVGGTFTATFWAWQLIDPALWEAIPTAANPIPTVDLDDNVYVTEVDIYREYNDPTAVSAVFYWEPEPSSLGGGDICSCCGGTGCTRCQLTTQDGCAHIRDAELGILTAAPATYDSVEQEWSSDSWTVCRDPDQIKFYYYCGDLSWLNLAGRRCDGLSDQWAQVIAYLATARLRLPICECGASEALVQYLQTDLAREGGGERYVMLWEASDNPFGTRRGEYEAWKFVSRLVRNSQYGAGAV